MKKFILYFSVIIFILTSCAVQKRYYPVFIIKERRIYHKPNRYDVMFQEADSAFNVWWADDIRNPENAEFVDEVSFNEEIPFCKVTQEQFNKRYEIK